MQKIRKGDQVVVTTGREKGKKGTVLRVIDDGQGAGRGREPREEAPAPQPREGPGRRHHRQGGPASHRSNVMLVNPATGKGDRVGFKFLTAQGDNPARKVRFFKSNGEVVDV